jgi:aspartate/methionine/tyrosine aminotransferase
MTRVAASRAAIPPFYVMEVMKAAGERERAGGDVLHLEVGQPSTGAPAVVVEAAARALGEHRLSYTDALGTPELRSRVSAWYADRYGVAVDPDRIAITGGASGACVLAFLACFDVGDRVAVAAPGYPCYRNMLSSFGIEVVDIEVDASSRFQLTAPVLARAIDERAPLAGVVVASPSNPTGTMLSADELGALAALCREHDIRLISDEIYHGITYGEAASTALTHDDGDQVVVMSSFSKYFSMTGWRLGWLVLPPHLVTPVERLAQNLTVAPPTLAQLAALSAFDAFDELDAHVERYGRNRAILLEGLRHAGFHDIAPADGAFYLWVDVRHLGIDSQVLCARWLEEIGVAATPGIDFDPGRGGDFVRFSFSGATADMVEAMRRLAAWTAAVAGAGARAGAAASGIGVARG